MCITDASFSIYCIDSQLLMIFMYLFLCIYNPLSVQHDNPFCKPLLKLYWNDSSCKHLAKSRPVSPSYSHIGFTNSLNNPFPLTQEFTIALYGLPSNPILRDTMFCATGACCHRGSKCVSWAIYFFLASNMEIFNSIISTNCLMADLCNLFCCIASDG